MAKITLPKCVCQIVAKNLYLPIGKKRKIEMESEKHSFMTANQLKISKKL